MTLTEFFTRFAGRELPLIVDHDPGAAAAREAGFADIRHGDDFEPQAFGGVALWMMSARASQAVLASLWDASDGIVVHLTDTKAGGDPHAVAYALASLDAADLPAVLAERQSTYERLLTHDVVRTRTAGAELICRIGDYVEIACDATELAPGEPYALTELLKASVVNIEAPTSTFRLDGTLVFDELLFQANSQALLDEHATRLRDWQRRAAAPGGNRLLFENNRAVGLFLGGQDRTQDLLDLCHGKEWETTATECAVGLLDLPPNPGLNTVFTQTRRGLHVGLGMGEQLPFLDFCAAHAEIAFADD